MHSIYLIKFLWSQFSHGSLLDSDLISKLLNHLQKLRQVRSLSTEKTGKNTDQQTCSHQWHSHICLLFIAHMWQKTYKLKHVKPLHHIPIKPCDHCFAEDACSTWSWYVIQAMMGCTNECVEQLSIFSILAESLIFLKGIPSFSWRHSGGKGLCHIPFQHLQCYIAHATVATIRVVTHLVTILKCRKSTIDLMSGSLQTLIILYLFHEQLHEFLFKPLIKNQNKHHDINATTSSSKSHTPPVSETLACPPARKMNNNWQFFFWDICWSW